MGPGHRDCRMLPACPPYLSVVPFSTPKIWEGRKVGDPNRGTQEGTHKRIQKETQIVGPKLGDATGDRKSGPAIWVPVWVPQFGSPFGSHFGTPFGFLFGGFGRPVGALQTELSQASPIFASSCDESSLPDLGGMPAGMRPVGFVAEHSDIRYRWQVRVR